MERSKGWLTSGAEVEVSMCGNISVSVDVDVDDGAAVVRYESGSALRYDFRTWMRACSILTAFARAVREAMTGCRTLATRLNLVRLS